jgi:hypothetical protein
MRAPEHAVLSVEVCIVCKNGAASVYANSELHDVIEAGCNATGREYSFYEDRSPDQPLPDAIICIKPRGGI